MNIQHIPTVTLGRVTKHAKIQQQCGTFAAAKMLKNRGYDLEQALTLLRKPAQVPFFLQRQAF